MRVPRLWAGRPARAPRVSGIAIIGTGFVADLYAASLRTFPQIAILGAWDSDPAALARFCAHWGVPAAGSLDELLGRAPELALNLTNPHAHHAVSIACLDAGVPVFSEKPMTTALEDARALHALANARGLQIASAPSSVLGEAAQTLGRALRDGRMGTPRLVYAELDDDFITQAPVAKWRSESGAPWPIMDELKVGCTLEHAGYYLAWLLMMFGPVETVVSASAQVTDASHITAGPRAPDYSSATLFFANGMVARLTCSIVAPHDHRLRVFGDGGVLEVARAWDNAAPVRARRRFVVRRRLVTSPWPRTIAPDAAARHPRVKRRGAASMNFALGPAEMLAAIRSGGKSRLAGDYALHLTEVTLAIQAAGRTAGAQAMTTRFDPLAPVDWPQIVAAL